MAAAAMHALGSSSPQLSSLPTMPSFDIQGEQHRPWAKVQTGDSHASAAEAVSFASPSSIWQTSAQATGEVSLDAHDQQLPRSEKRYSMENDVEQLPKGAIRRRVHYVLESRLCKGLVACIILVNAWQVVFETDTTQDCKYALDSQTRSEACDHVHGWLADMNVFYLAFYILELCLRIYVDKWSFFFSKWDLFDFVVVIGSVVGQVVSADSSNNSFAFLRLCRMLRLFKAFRWVQLPRELHIMIHGILGAIRATVYGFALLSAMLVFWSVLAVEILNGANHDDELLRHYDEVDCERCPRAWESVWQSCLSFMQLTLMGDSWGGLAIPLVERHPPSILLFAGAFLTIAMILVNLILAVILEKALQQRQEDDAQTAHAQEKLTKRAKQGFVELCRRIDSDQSGYLSLAEYLDGYETVQGFRDQLTIMGIGSEDLETLFHMMDKNRSGAVSYADFADQLVTMKNQDLHAMSSFIKHQIVELANELADLKAVVVPRDEVLRLQAQRRIGSRSSLNLSGSAASSRVAGSSKGGSHVSLPPAASSGSLAPSERGAKQEVQASEDRPQGTLRRAATTQPTKMSAREFRQHAAPLDCSKLPASSQETFVLIEVLQDLKTIAEHLRQNTVERRPKNDAGHLEAGHKSDAGQVTPVSGSPKSYSSLKEVRNGTDHANGSNGTFDPQSRNGMSAHEGRSRCNSGTADGVAASEPLGRTMAEAVPYMGGNRHSAAEIQVHTRPSAFPSRTGHQPEAFWCQQLYCRHVTPEEHEIPLERAMLE